MRLFGRGREWPYDKQDRSNTKQSARGKAKTKLDTEDMAWAEGVLEAESFQKRLAKIGFSLGNKETDWTLYDKERNEIAVLSRYADDDSDTCAENFVRDIVRLVDKNEAFQGFEKYYRRAIAVGWEMMLEDIDLHDSDKESIEVERPVAYDVGRDYYYYQSNVYYPLSIEGLHQFILDLTDEEVWRSLMSYFDDIDSLGWRIVRGTGEFILYTNDACYKRVLHPLQETWLSDMIEHG